MHAHTELRNPIQLPERQIEKFAKHGCFCSRQECARFVHIPSSRHIIYGCSHVDKLMKQFCSAPAVDINFLYEDSFAFPLQASLRSALAVKISMSEKHGLQNSAGLQGGRIAKPCAAASQKAVGLAVSFCATAPEPHPFPQFFLPFSCTFYIIRIVQTKLPEQDFPQGGIRHVRPRSHDARPHDV